MNGPRLAGSSVQKALTVEACAIMNGSDALQYNNGTWAGEWVTPKGKKLLIFVNGDATFMNSEAALARLEQLRGVADSIIEKASEAAKESVYNEDITAENGLVVDGIVVLTWERLLVWYYIGDSNRRLAVTMQDGRPCDFYCEPPTCA